MVTAYLNIGSNLGDSMAFLEQAVAQLAISYSQSTLRRSDFIKSAPCGYNSDNIYINIGIALDFDSTPDPFEMLRTVQQIERQISDVPHRNPDGSYRDREVDIDIISIDGVQIYCPSLILPHPRASHRRFVMEPLRQLGGRLC